ncbi:hypothetical protein M3J09_010534 [Ascochyta lentis]
MGTHTFDAVFKKSPPSKDLRLPTGGHNIGAVELCTFLPDSLKNHDVCRRLFINGLNRHHISNIINHHLQLARGDVTPNLVLKWMQASMRRVTGDKNWTYTKDAKKIDRKNWNTNDLTLTGCKLDIEHKPPQDPKRIKVEHYPFHLLGQHVKLMPQGEDRLDLTRCVEYALDHPQENLQFPQDFGMLVERLGGPTKVTPGNLDSAVATRWESPLARIGQAQMIPFPSEAVQKTFGGESLAYESKGAMEAETGCTGSSQNWYAGFPALNPPHTKSDPAVYNPCKAHKTIEASLLSSFFGRGSSAGANLEALGSNLKRKLNLEAQAESGNDVKRSKCSGSFIIDGYDGISGANLFAIVPQNEEILAFGPHHATDDYITGGQQPSGHSANTQSSTSPELCSQLSMDLLLPGEISNGDFVHSVSQDNFEAVDFSIMEHFSQIYPGFLELPKDSSTLPSKVHSDFDLPPLFDGELGSIEDFFGL